VELRSDRHGYESRIIANDSIYFCFIEIVKRISRQVGRVGVFLKLGRTAEMASTGAKAGLVLWWLTRR
jgi:hypothetical protein